MNRNGYSLRICLRIFTWPKALLRYRRNMYGLKFQQSSTIEFYFNEQVTTIKTSFGCRTFKYHLLFFHFRNCLCSFSVLRSSFKIMHEIVQIWILRLIVYMTNSLTTVPRQVISIVSFNLDNSICRKIVVFPKPCNLNLFKSNMNRYLSSISS